MRFQIKSRFDGLVKAEVEIKCSTNASEATKLGRAVLAALQSRANLRSAHLGGANLRGTNLGGADLRGANLGGANLRGAHLGGANLRGANLRGADLYGANLRSAHLRGADLYGANLRGADLYGANLGGRCGKVKRLITSTVRSDGYQFFAWEREEGGCHIIAGCQNRSLASYRERVKDTYSAEERRAALIAETTDILDFIEKRYEATK